MSTAAVDESLASLVSLMGLISAILGVVLYVWTALALSAVFRKMGEEQWRAWVPFLNIATVLRWGGFSPWLVLLAVVPIAQVVVFVLLIVSAHRINAGFGYGAGMTVLAALVFVVWASVLGFGPARWLGARAPARSPVRGEEPTADAVAPPTVSIAVSPDAEGPFQAAAAAAGLPVTSDGEADAREADAITFAPPAAASGRVDWTPPDTAPPAASTPWPEIDDVSAIHPSPFPPSSAGGRPYVPPPAGDLSASAEASDAGRRRAASASPGEPIAAVPGARSEVEAPLPAASVTRVPAAAARRDEIGHPPAERPEDRPADLPADIPEDRPAEDGAAAPAPAAPPSRSRRRFDADDPDAFPELSGEVSAVVGAPRAGAPRPAVGAVPAQHRRRDEPEEAVDSPGARRARPEPPVRGAAAVDADDEVSDVTVIARRGHRATWELVPVSGAPIPLSSSVVILGRRPAGDAAFPQAQLVAVPDEARTVSKTHARLELRDDAWIVTDLASTNGVLVRTLMGDEVEVEPGARLDAGERFFLGDEEFHLRRVAH